MSKIRIGIFGYGNLGRGVELAVGQNPDLSLVGIFTRRDPDSLSPATDATVYSASDILQHKEQIDVLILCGGSAKDLPVYSPQLAKHFHIVDSFDTHARIPEHFASCDRSATDSRHIAVISAGWDPGMFSLQRLYGAAVLPEGCDYTFWGRGVSQGHSDALRRIEGVQDARQYTVPVASALEQVRAGQMPDLTTREKHLRECFVVPRPGADLEVIRKSIVTMPDYFADYDTSVTFLSQEELDRDHKGLPHGGVVFRCGVTGSNGSSRQRIEYSLKLDSNPEFTGSILVACARAAWRLAERGQFGAKTMLDIPPALLSPKTPEELRKTLL